MSRGARATGDRPMHPLRILAAAAAFTLASSAGAVQVCEIDGESVNPNHGGTTRGKTGLMRCRDKDSGQLLREQELRDGVFMGRERFYRDGKLERDFGVNARGNRHGPARELAPDGTVLREATYDDGNEVGLVRSFHPDGKLRRAGFHQRAGGEQAAAEFTARGQLARLRCGDRPLLAPAVDDARLCGFEAVSQVDLYGEDGRVRSRLRLREGKPQRQEVLHANGQPASVDETDGTRRTMKRYADDGVQRRETVWLLGERGAARELEREFSERGTLVREQRWADGELASDRSFYLNGQPRSSTDYQRGGTQVLSVAREHHDNGAVAFEGRYAGPLRGRGQPLAQGTHQRFDEGGRKVAETVHDAQGRPARERAWDAQGALVRDEEVFEDGSRRAFAK